MKSLLRTEAARYEGAEVVVECATLLTMSEKNDLVARLTGKMKRGADYLDAYTDAVVQTRKAKGLGFELPSASADDEVHIASFDAFIQLPIEFSANWINALRRVSVAPGTKPELQPGVETKSPLSSEGEAMRASA